jgi:hypothetical protein
MLLLLDLLVPAAEWGTLSRRFAQVLELAARCRVLKVGDFTVAIDGSRVLAKAEASASVCH